MHTISATRDLRRLFPEARAALLSKLLLSDRRWYMRELARAVGMAIRTIAVELHGLEDAGIVAASRSGNRVYYEADRSCPFYAELKGIIVKTVGVADPIKRYLLPFADHIRLAYIYGSFAVGDANSGSDIDLMIVGETTAREIATALTECERELGREINATVSTIDEYRERIALGEGFLYEVSRGPKIAILGVDIEP